MQPILLRADDPWAADAVHDVEAFGPVSTIMPYRDLADAIALANRGMGSLALSLFTNDPAAARDFIQGAAAFHGRMLVINRDNAAESTGHGSPLPVLVHGGPGRAGGSEEMGGVRGVKHYMQRTAIQSTPAMIAAISAQYIPGGPKRFVDGHPFTKRMSELHIGDTLRTDSRTVTIADIEHFAEFTGDKFYAHMDEEAAKASPIFEGRVAHGYLILSFAAGLFVWPDPGPVLANTGLENLKFLTPLYPGDSMRVELTVRSKSLKSEETGVVRWAVEIFNQKDDLVATYDLLTENLPTKEGRRIALPGLRLFGSRLKPGDRLVDQRLVGLGIAALGDQLGRGGGRGLGGDRADLVDRGAFLGGDLRFGHRGAPLDQRLGIASWPWPRSPWTSALARSTIAAASLVGGGGLGLIFGLQRFGFGAERLGFVQLGADFGDLAVQRLADRGRHLLPQEQRQHRDHRQRDPRRRGQAERRRLDEFGCSPSASVAGDVSSSIGHHHLHRLGAVGQADVQPGDLGGDILRQFGRHAFDILDRGRCAPRGSGCERRLDRRVDRVVSFLARCFGRSPAVGLGLGGQLGRFGAAGVHPGAIGFLDRIGLGRAPLRPPPDRPRSTVRARRRSTGSWAACPCR